MTSALGEKRGTDVDDLQPGGAPTVLLLDDDEMTLLTLHALLERVNANIIECANERSVLQSCEQPATSIDLFVADVVLPAGNGPAVVRKVKPRHPRMRQLFMSGFSLSELGRRGLLSKNDLCPGTIEFLQKPFAPDTFLETVEKLLQRTN